MAYETIIPSIEVHVNGETLTVKIDHILDPNDETEQYTGRYRATINMKTQVNVELNEDAVWVESGKGPTELASALGSLIESYSE